MEVNLVSSSQWQRVYNWATNKGYVFDHAGSGNGTNYPVEMLNWWDCVKWFNPPAIAVTPLATICSGRLVAKG